MTSHVQSNGITAVLSRCGAAIESYSKTPDDPEVWQDLTNARRQAAEAVAGLPSDDCGSPAVEAARGLVRQIAAAGALDRPTVASDIDLAERLTSSGWPGLLASMVVAAAFRRPRVPSLADVPRWLWRDWMSYVFYAPQGFSAIGDADAYADHWLSRCEEVAAAVEKLADHDAAELAEAFLAACNCIPLYFNTSSLRRHYELRGRLLARAAAAAPGGDHLSAKPRADRRLRVGFVNLHFGPQTETYTTLPMFQHLDPERFEVLLFVRHSGRSQVEAFARTRVAAAQVLPADLTEQVRLIRDAALDVAVIGTNTTAVFNEITRLALRRLAPLQIVNNSSCTTSGLPASDLYVSGALTELPEATEHFTERLALLPGPTHAFNYACDRQPACVAWTRSALGLRDDELVFVTAANYFKIIPEMRRVWAQLLAATPGSCLLVHPFNPNWSSQYPIRRFAHEFAQILAEYGVPEDRLVLTTARLPSRSDVKNLLAVGDIYLDTYPFSGVNSLVDPLENGTPTIAWEGRTFRSRMGAALLRALGLDELVADGEESYLAIARRLAESKSERASLRSRIVEAMGRPPIFLDTLAAADAFEGVLESAYDELVRVGRDAWRAARAPVVAHLDGDVNETVAKGVAALARGAVAEALAEARRVLHVEPTNAAARRLMGGALLAQGRADRAALYLLAALPSFFKDADIWYHLGLALRATGQLEDSFKAAQTSVQLDGGRREAWLLMAELAEGFSRADLAARLRERAASP